MCGIAGFHVFGDYMVPNLNAFVDKLLEGIEHRGRDATGFGYVCDNGDSLVSKACIPATKFVKLRKRIPPDARTVLLHTRLATNGDPAFPENNHPTIAGSVLAVHNGVIYNDHKLFDRVSTPRMGDVDSEVIPALTNHYGLDNLDQFIDEVDGSFALAIADAARPGDLRLVRGPHSPLYVYKTDKLVVWASTYATIKEAWALVFGTPPAFKNVEAIDEGQVLAYDKMGELPTEGFSFDASWYSYVFTQGSSTPTACQLSMPRHETVAPYYGKCDICDTYVEDDELTFDEGLWMCDDCAQFVLGTHTPHRHESLETAAEKIVNDHLKEGGHVVLTA